MTNNSASLFTKNEGTSTDTGYSIHGGGNKSEDPLGTNNENNNTQGCIRGKNTDVEEMAVWVDI